MWTSVLIVEVAVTKTLDTISQQKQNAVINCYYLILFIFEVEI